MQEIVFQHAYKREEYTAPVKLLREDFPPHQGDPLFRKWLLILIGRMWDDFEPCFSYCDKANYIEGIIEFAKEDKDPEVRAAAIYAIGTYIGCSLDESTASAVVSLSHVAARVADLKADACFLVRKEIVYSLQVI